MPAVLNARLSESTRKGRSSDDQYVAVALAERTACLGREGAHQRDTASAAFREFKMLAG
jgi:hypothetical protein